MPERKLKSQNERRNYSYGDGPGKGRKKKKDSRLGQIAASFEGKDGKGVGRKSLTIAIMAGVASFIGILLDLELSAP